MQLVNGLFPVRIPMPWESSAVAGHSGYCGNCGTYFEPADKRSIYCSQSCASIATRRNLEWKGVGEAICTICGTKFKKKLKVQVYCCHECKIESSRRRAREKKKCQA